MKKHKLLKFVGIGFILLSLQSCFVAKDYTRPEIVEEEFYRTDMLPQDTTSIADIPWREIFTDQVLISHIEEALEENIDIRVALQQIEAARAYVKQGNAGYFPSLNANATALHQELSQNSQPGISRGSFNQFELSASLSWEADIWGKIRSTDRAFTAGYLQSLAAHKAVRTELIASLATLYYQLLALDQQIAITQETIETRENSLETINALKKAGMVTAVAVLQSQAQVYRAQALLVDLTTSVHLLENTFSILLGEAPHHIERTSLAEQEIDMELEIGVPALLLSNRPDVIAAEYNLVNAFELTNVARSSFYPSLRLTATGGLQSVEFEELFNVNSLFASLIGSLAQPIFNQRQIRTQYEVAQAEQEIAYLNFKRTFLIATREVSDALYSYEAAGDKIELKLKEYQAYEQAIEFSQELLNNGLANYLEVLSARENALNASLEVVNAKFNKLSATVELYEALGGGWE